MTSILVKIEAVLDSEVGHGYCGIEENINPSICRIKQAMAKIEPLISEEYKKGYIDGGNDCQKAINKVQDQGFEVLKDQGVTEHGRVSTDNESIYNNCATYRIMVKR